MISVSVKTNHANETDKFFGKIRQKQYLIKLDRFGARGVDALSKATPKKTGLTASSWKYKVIEKPDTIELVWTNSNNVDGVPLVILLQYGHATRNGGFVKGVDFINPALKPIFDNIAKEAWEVLIK